MEKCCTSNVNESSNGEDSNDFGSLRATEMLVKLMQMIDKPTNLGTVNALVEQIAPKSELLKLFHVKSVQHLLKKFPKYFKVIKKKQAKVSGLGVNAMVLPIFECNTLESTNPVDEYPTVQDSSAQIPASVIDESILFRKCTERITKPMNVSVALKLIEELIPIKLKILNFERFIAKFPKHFKLITKKKAKSLGLLKQTAVIP